MVDTKEIISQEKAFVLVSQTFVSTGVPSYVLIARRNCASRKSKPQQLSLVINSEIVATIEKWMSLYCGFTVLSLGWYAYHRLLTDYAIVAYIVPCCFLGLGIFAILGRMMDAQLFQCL